MPRLRLRPGIVRCGPVVGQRASGRGGGRFRDGRGTRRRRCEMTVKQLTCIDCGRVYPPGARDDVCEDHPGLEGILRVEYDWAAPTGSPRPSHDTLRAFSEMLPLSEQSLERLPHGWITQTPLIAAPRLTEELGLGFVAVKDEGRNPTGSLKDRSSTLAALLAIEQGKTDICCASTGNAATSLAGI